MKRKFNVDLQISDAKHHIAFDIVALVELDTGGVLSWWDYFEKGFSDNPLEIPLGMSEGGEIVRVPSLTTDPHILFAGRTGSGKSVTQATLELGYLYANSPESIGLCICDPHNGALSKALENSIFNYFR